MIYIVIWRASTMDKYNLFEASKMVNILKFVCVCVCVCVCVYIYIYIYIYIPTLAHEQDVTQDQSF